jgi:hypothetical protein
MSGSQRSGVLVVEFQSHGGPFSFTAQDHTEFVDAFYRIAPNRENRTVILTGAGGRFPKSISHPSATSPIPTFWNQVLDEFRSLRLSLLGKKLPGIF